MGDSLMKASVDMKTALLLLLVMTLAWATFTVDMSQVTADILPRVRCRFSKDLYQYGEPVIFHLDVDILPNTSLSETYLEELRPDGSVNTGSSPVPTQPPIPSPTSTRITIMPQPTNVPSGQAAMWPWLPPLLIIIVVAAILLVLYRGIGAEESTRTGKRTMLK
jgi:hypothetical protein